MGDIVFLYAEYCHKTFLLEEKKLLDIFFRISKWKSLECEHFFLYSRFKNLEDFILCKYMNNHINLHIVTKKYSHDNVEVRLMC